MYNYDYVQGLLKQYHAAELNRQVSPGETMMDQWYFEMGRYAVEAIALALMASRIKNHLEGPGVSRVLDIPCGHGRVLRHLVRLFPDAQIVACDLDREGVDFCSSVLGAVPIHSKEELTAVDLGGPYDLIWVGSLFTHTSRDVTRRWMAYLARFLSPIGIVVATLHGRWSEHVHTVAPYIGQGRWEKILKGYATTGYGYCDYEKSESHPFISGSYGISLVKPHVTIRDIEDIPDTRIYLYLERGWSDHQDVVAFGRPAYNLPWPNMVK